MTAIQLLSTVAQATYVVVFVATFLTVVRRPTRANVDVAIFFGAIAFVIVESRVADLLGIESALLSAIAGSIAIALPYLLLRLVDDFTTVPQLVKRGAEIGLGVSVVAFFTLGDPLPLVARIALVVYFFVLAVYDAAMFIVEARVSRGVTRRRMQSVALATLLLGGTILLAGFRPIFPAALGDLTRAAQHLLTLASGVAFFVGFAPPRVLRRSWQEPELRAFLGRAATLPRLPTTEAIIGEMEHAAARTTGGNAAIALWDEPEEKLQLRSFGEKFDLAPGQWIAGRAFSEQRLIYSDNPARDAPDAAAHYREFGIGAIIAAPITAGDRRLGVLRLAAARPPIFADSDAELVRLLADQAAVILESRALIDEAARVRAREEATRLKDDFLSAAAHDLKTPLTTVIAQAQILERRASNDLHGAAYIDGLRRLASESGRLGRLVRELLEASRVAHGGLVGEREPVNLADVAKEVCARRGVPERPCELDAVAAVIGAFDRQRVEQLLENLVENGQKFSVDATPVRVRVWSENGEARIAVSDGGIGITEEDRAHLFERFHRGSNVDDRRFPGMGLGLYICRGIVEQHGGRIWAQSEPGRGTTVNVALPAMAEGRVN